MNNEFRQKLILAVDLAGLSRSKLAREIGVDKSVVSRWMSGATRPSPASLDQLTEHLASRIHGLRLSNWDLPMTDFAAKFVRALPGNTAAYNEPDDDDEQRQNVQFCRTPDGINLAVASAGQGRVLVKAPNYVNHVDYDMASPIWGPTLRRLAQNHRLVRYDARGNGLSDWSCGVGDFETAVRDFGTVVDWLGVERISILGISQGTAIALAYAITNPMRVERLVLHGGFARGRRKRGDDLQIEHAKLLNSLTMIGWPANSPTYVNALASLFIPSASPDQIRSFGLLQRVYASAANVVEMRRWIDDVDIISDLPAVKAPTLVTHCRHDQITPLEEGRLVAAGIPSATFATLETDNHVSMPGEPAWGKWFELIEEFFGRCTHAVADSLAMSGSDPE